MSFVKITVSVFCLVLGIVLFYGLLILKLTWPVTEYSVSNAGVFGDSFGVITSLFSGLAFAGIIATILLQRQELTESREIFKSQRFESSFYRLLDLYRKNLEDIKITNHISNENHKGIDALHYLCKKLSASMQIYSSYLDTEDGVKVYGNQLFIEVEKMLIRQSRYLGTLQSILELIERDMPEYDERRPYWNILASQITTHEMKYLFYCCLVAPKYNILRELLHRSNILTDRISYTSTGKIKLALYSKMHGVDFSRPKSELVLPYDAHEMRLIRKKIKKARS